MKHPFQGRRKDDLTQENTESSEQSFVGKLGSFFNPEPQKEKVLRHEDFTAAGDPYYATVSAGYKIAGRVFWLFFVVFMVFSIATNYKEITYDNFFYLIKDFTSAADAGNNTYETLSYESDSRQTFTLYRGGVATVSPSRLSIFTATGRRTLRESSGFSSPYAISSDQYLLIYDTSGTTFSIYNSFARVYNKTLDYPITDACLGSDGSFAIVTRSADSRSVIRTYDKRFKELREINADYYVFDIQINAKENLLSFLYYDAGNGTGRTVLSVRAFDTLEQIDSVAFEGEFPLGCGYLENNRFAVVTDRCIRILDDVLETVELSDDYWNGTITGFSIDEEGVAVCATEASKNYVFAFDKSGSLLYNDTVDAAVSDIAVCGGYLFLQTEGGITRLDPSTEIREELPTGYGKMLIYNENTALVCGESKAEYLIFKNH